MNRQLALVLGVLWLASCLALFAGATESQSSSVTKRTTNAASYVFKKQEGKSEAVELVKGDLVKPMDNGDECKVCIDVAVEMIDVLLNAVLNGGILGDCADLCSRLNNSNIEEDLCDAICDSVGLDEFVKILKKFSNDIDPVYFCQLVHLCEVDDCTGSCGDVLAFVIDPQMGSTQTTFYINSTLAIYQEIGAGMLSWTWTNVDNSAYSTDYQSLVTSFSPGTFDISLEVYPDAYNGIPPGNWTVNFSACEGMCGSTLPNTAVIASANSWMYIAQ